MIAKTGSTIDLKGLKQGYVIDLQKLRLSDRFLTSLVCSSPNDTLMAPLTAEQALIREFRSTCALPTGEFSAQARAEVENS